MLLLAYCQESTMVLHMLMVFKVIHKSSPQSHFPQHKFPSARPVPRLSKSAIGIKPPCTYSCFSLSERPSSFNISLMLPHFKVWLSPSTILILDLTDFAEL